MNIKELFYKSKEKFRIRIISFMVSYGKDVILYPSFWHMKLRKSQTDNKYYKNYFTARPNPGAGIGHQLANWIAGYWFARQFDLNYVYMNFSNSYIPYSKSKWDSFLGLYQDEIKIEELVNNHKYKIIHLPLFNEKSIEQVEIVKKIISSYQNKKVIFLAEQDQFYRDQFGVMEDLKKKFYSNPARKIESLIYKSDEINIAIHVRRGDIVQIRRQKNYNLSMRWQNIDYFFNVLNQVINIIGHEKKVSIYLFSQGINSDFIEFEKFDNIHFCLDMSATDSFLHMVMSDVLITSKSSFSYKPALLNRGIKVCPEDFWHGYPKTIDWVLADNNGNLLNNLESFDKLNRRMLNEEK